MPRGRVVGVAVLGGVMVASCAGAQSFHSSAQTSYDRVEGARLATPYASWGKTVTADWAKQLTEFSLQSHFRFTEQTIVGERTRMRSPEADLRLNHRSFGLATAYRPSESRDQDGAISRHQTLSLTGYAQKEGLPTLSASWIRSHDDPHGHVGVGSSRISRDLAATYGIGAVSLHAGVGDRLLYRDGERNRPTDDHANIGGSTHFMLGRVPASAAYDFSQSHSSPGTALASVSRSHSAQASGSYAFSPRTNASFSYAFQRSENVGLGSSRTDLHNGSLSLAHNLSHVVALSASGGFRRAHFGEESKTERFLSASGTAQGQARPGWLMSASLSHSQNWFPGQLNRPAESATAGTTMRLSRRLSARADASLSSVAQALSATLSRRVFEAHGGLGLSATPLRTLAVNLSAQRNRSGGNILRRGQASTTYGGDVRLTPTARLSLSASRFVVRFADGRNTSLQTAMSWTPVAILSVSGGYNRAEQAVPGVASAMPRQESYNASAVVALGWRLTSTIRYAESNPRRSNQVRQFGFTVSRPFGR